MTRVVGLEYEAALRDVVGRHRLVTRLHVKAETGSTNDDGLRLARDGAPGGTLLVADRQTSGRGRHGRSWDSPAGMGLWFSLILRPDVSLDRAFGVTAAAAVAVTRCVNELTGREAGIRWPNDVMVGSRKVAGLLAEVAGIGNRLAFIVLGVGLNVVQDHGDFPAALRDDATSIRLLSGSAVDRARVLDDFLERFAGAYDSLVRDDGAGVRDDWCRLAPMIGQRVRVDLGGDPPEVLHGTATGLSPDGALILSLHGGERRVHAGDVRLLRAEPGDGR